MTDDLPRIPIRELQSQTRGTFDLLTWWITLNCSVEDLVLHPGLSETERPDPDGNPAVFVHELTHFLQTVASPTLVKLSHDIELMYATVLEAIAEEETLETIPIPIRLETANYSKLNWPSVRSSRHNLSLYDILEGEAVYYQHFWMPPRDRNDTGVRSISQAMDRLEKASEDRHVLKVYTKAYTTANKFFDEAFGEALGRGAVDVLFPYLCNFAIYGAYMLRTRDGRVCDSPVELFVRAMEFLGDRRNWEVTDMILRQSHAGPEIVHSFFMNEISEGLELGRISGGEDFLSVALQNVFGNMGDEQLLHEAPKWLFVKRAHAFTRLVGSMMGSGHQDFIYPFRGDAFKRLCSEIGMPSLVFGDEGTGKVEVSSQTPEASSLLHRGMLMTAMGFLFEDSPTQHVCPHQTCDFHRLGLCSSWYAYGPSASRCSFPEQFEGHTGLPLSRISRARRKN